jgi:hypothetical protein
VRTRHRRFGDLTEAFQSHRNIQRRRGDQEALAGDPVALHLDYQFATGFAAVAAGQMQAVLLRGAGKGELIVTGGGATALFLDNQPAILHGDVIAAAAIFAYANFPGAAKARGQRTGRAREQKDDGQKPQPIHEIPLPHYRQPGEAP